MQHVLYFWLRHNERFETEVKKTCFPIASTTTMLVQIGQFEQVACSEFIGIKSRSGHLSFMLLEYSIIFLMYTRKVVFHEYLTELS